MKKLKILAIAILGIAFLMPITRNLGAEVVASSTKAKYEEKVFRDEIVRTYKLKDKETAEYEKTFTKRDEEKKLTKTFKLLDIEEIENKKTEKKEVSETKSYPGLTSNDGTGIPEIISYTKDGFKGEMKRTEVSYQPIYNTVRWEEEEKEIITRSYPGLKDGDLYTIPKTVVEYGNTFDLLTYDAIPMTDGSKLYTWNCTYSRIIKVPRERDDLVGYSATATFKGEAKKEIVESKTLTAIYKLEREEKDRINPWLIVAGAGGGVIIIGVPAFLIFFAKRRKKKRFSEGGKEKN